VPKLKKEMLSSRKDSSTALHSHILEQSAGSHKSYTNNWKNRKVVGSVLDSIIGYTLAHTPYVI
jgi:hypothetical protein